MHKIDIVRAWKDPLYRASLSPEELAHLPANPAGAIELTDEQLKGAAGGAPLDPTAWTYHKWRSCCTTI
jgi:mersacidin/lichenicidin family type 2 lantibiotic